MKTGIFTFHNPTNYGAAFQAYALKEAVSRLTGHDVEIIDYTNPRISAESQLQAVKQNHSAKGIVKQIIALPYMKRKLQLFQTFLKKHGNLSPITYDRSTIHTCQQVYDTVIFGSDQIWNLNLTDSDWNYFGAFSNRVRKIAYAASIGNFDLRTVAADAEEKLGAFSALSCREETTCAELAEIFGFSSAHVLDPTLLLTGEDWRKLKQPVKTPEEYILLYLISPQSEDFRFAKQLSKQTGLPVLYVNYSFKKYPGVTNLGAVSPENFLHLLDGAAYVVTNSFHGTVLSVNLHKDFYCQIPAKKGKANQRVLNILRQLELQDRCLYDDMQMTVKCSPDWAQVDLLLEQKRIHSKEFLKHALEMNHEQTV